MLALGRGGACPVPCDDISLFSRCLLLAVALELACFPFDIFPPSVELKNLCISAGEAFLRLELLPGFRPGRAVTSFGEAAMPLARLLLSPEEFK